MKNQCYELTNTTEAEFEAFCKENKLSKYKVESKTKFFKLILANKIVRDKSTGQLVRRKR